MVSDGRNEQSDREREQFLEEIRRRAEEAELRRIEEEESGTIPASSVLSSPPSSTPAIPSPDDLASTDLPERIVLLRARIEAAVERGNIANAVDLLAELRTSAPNDLATQELVRRVGSLRLSPTKVHPPVPEVPRVDTSHKHAELLERARAAYEQEHYLEALSILDQLLAQDSTDEDALHLKAEVVRARELAEVIRQEEAAHRASEQEQFTKPPAIASEPAAPPDKGVWGSTQVPPKSEFEGFPVEAPSPPPIPRPPVLDRLAARLMRIRIPVKPLVVVMLVLVLGAVAYVVVEHFLHTVVPPRASLLITFDANAADDADRNVAAGLSDDLFVLFSRVPVLRVINVPSTAIVTGESPSPRRNARRVEAQYVLHSAIRVRDGLLVWEAMLLDTVGQSPLWSNRYESPIDESQRTALALVHDVLRVLDIESDRAVLPAQAESSGTDLSAYAAYGAGRAALVFPTRDSRSRARSLFRAAIAEDTTLASAYAALGWATMLEVESDRRGMQDSVGGAMACAQRSLLLGPPRSESYRILGLADYLHKNYEGSVEHFRRATALCPSDAEAQRRLGVVLLVRGDSDGALEAFQSADAADPLNPVSSYLRGLAHQFRGEFDNAYACYTRSVQLAGSRTGYGSELQADVLMYLQEPDRAVASATDRATRLRGNPDALYRLARIGQGAGLQKAEWTTHLERAKGTLRDSTVANPSQAMLHAMLALVHTRLGEFKDALESSTKAIQLGSDDALVLYGTARMYALHRDHAKALEFLTKAVDNEYLLPEILDMDLFNLRSDPEFIRAITR